MALPASLKPLIVEALGVELVSDRHVSGGDISRAARATLADGREIMIKWRSGPPHELFAAEQHGLDLLRSAGALRVPQVLAHGQTVVEGMSYIVLEWLGRGASSRRVLEALGIGLAKLHQTTAAQYGLERDNFIGTNPQLNQPGDNWVTFFRDRRLAFQMELAARNNYLSTRRGRLLERLLARLVEWLPPRPPASLLHGDLWGGNWLVTGAGQAALIDPAVYYGHREAELAFTGLFGGFSETFYAAYNHTWPLEPGYNERKDLYNLYHLLNHLNLFGESYGGSVDAILRNYVG